MPSPKTLMPHPAPPRPKRRRNVSRTLSRPVLSRHPWVPGAITILLFVATLFSLPGLLAYDLSHESGATDAVPQPSFPVTVYPAEEVIVEDPVVEEFLSVKPGGNLTAGVGILETAFTWLAVRVSEFPVYRQLAGAAGIDTLFVTVYPGYRAEEVSLAFGSKLGWTRAQRLEFLEAARELEPRLSDGQFVPGTYFVGVTDPAEVAGITHERFDTEILARYGSTTDAQVPLEDAITIASLIEREAGGWDDMRLISGIIWNRLFNGMSLQIDATMQYAKATNAGGKGGWWPKALPEDKTIRSAYNTYRQAGLPPGPIANPSVAAILAALNPKKTECLFYFHDKYGRFHCSPTYEGHVTLLKKYYGRGK